ncbi:GNAT family N-acetyltransferase [Sphaerisporangium sp. NPDC088356]|uniref:GNAT family N-acetyltransferase n=1 Tax=Sphaerisporangium sp. NPDC088356 TaxID=3154871 RepID=UPI00343E8C0F
MTLPTRIERDLVEIVQAKHPEDMTPEATRELVNCWMTVANNGGAVGFAFPPVGIDDVSPVAEQLIADLDPEYNRLLLAKLDGVLAGWLSLSRYRDPLVPHWGMVKRVQTHPDFRGRGIGATLMQRVREVARDELGLEQLRLEARGEEGLEDFYRRLGWQEIGRWPGALRFDHGDRDEVLMLLTPL